MATDVTPDDELLERLRAVASIADPVPDDVVLAGRSAIAHRDLDARLAELVAEDVTTGVRGEDEPWFTFEVDDVVIEVAIRRRGDRQQLVGQVDGVSPRTVTVRSRGSEAEASVDQLGRFSMQVEPGPLRVELGLEDGLRVATSWIVTPSG